MARPLSGKTNVTPPGGNYPYGRAKDDSGANDGTPVDENLLGDAIQFFEKLLADGGVTANGNPENSADGFQYAQALDAIITNLISSNRPFRSVIAGSGLGGGGSLSGDVTLDVNVDNTTIEVNSDTLRVKPSFAATKADVAQAVWTNLTLINGWASIAGSAKYRITDQNYLQTSCILSAGGATASAFASVSTSLSSLGISTFGNMSVPACQGGTPFNRNCVISTSSGGFTLSISSYDVGQAYTIFLNIPLDAGQ